MNTRRLALVVLAVASLTAVVGSGAFSSVSAERGVYVSVVDDEDAYLGLSWHELDRCGEQDFVTVQNRFATPLLDVDVAVEQTDRLDATVSNVPDHLGVGESATVRIRLEPENADEVDDRSVAVRIETHGPSATVEVDQRERTVTNCPTRGMANSTDGTVANETGDQSTPS